MTGLGGTTGSFERDSNFNNDTDNSNNFGLPLPTSSLEYNGGNFISMLFQPSPPRSPINMSTNLPNGFTTNNFGFGVVQPCQHMTTPTSSGMDPFCSYQIGNIANENPTQNLFFEEPSFRTMNLWEPQVYEHSIMAPTHQQYSSYQSAAEVNVNYEQQNPQLPNSLRSLRNFLVEIRDDLQRTMENLATLENYRPPPPLFEGIPIEDEDNDDEDEDEDDGSNMEEDDGVDNDDDEDAEVEDINEEATGNTNSEPLVENNTSLQEEENEAMQKGENDGVEVEDILAGLGSQVYERPLDDTQPPSCSICLEEFKQGELLGILDCEHIYHYICIGEWLLIRNSCPLCRVVAI